jgi:hypothetical protein
MGDEILFLEGSKYVRNRLAPFGDRIERTRSEKERVAGFGIRGNRFAGLPWRTMSIA